MSRILELTSRFVQSMPPVNEFKDWFRPIVDATGIKYKVVAEAAGITPESFSRILSGSQGIKVETAVSLAQAVNRLTGRHLADEQKAAQLAVGITSDRPRQRPKNVLEFLEILESWGLEFGPVLTGDKRLEDFTEDDFEDLLERVRRDVLGDIEITLRRKER